MRKVIYIEWDDSATEGGWKHPTDIETRDMAPLKCWSIGFLVKDTAKYVTLSHSETEQGDVNAYISVPKSAITKRRYVKL